MELWTVGVGIRSGTHACLRVASPKVKAARARLRPLDAVCPYRHINFIYVALAADSELFSRGRPPCP